jgi:hypothetical protein
MKTYDASLIKVLEETEHYARIYHPALGEIKTADVIHFFEWLRSVGYRYLEGDAFAAKYVICEKVNP